MIKYIKIIRTFCNEAHIFVQYNGLQLMTNELNMNYISTLKKFAKLLFIIAFYLQGTNGFVTASELKQENSSLNINADVVDLYRSVKKRPIKVDIWYKDHACAVKACQPTPDKKLNIAILSHGVMGSAKDYSWLAYPLAAQGWIVIGVNHFGESWRYGRENIDPSSVTRFWQRTEDVSFTIDSLDTILPKKLASTKANIVVIGHSSGGYTAAALAGVSLEGKQMYEYCASKQATGDLGCSYGKREGLSEIKSSDLKLSSGLDSRINKIIMLDPAMGPASTVNSMQSVAIPVLIIGSKDNDFLPFEYHAKFYADNIPNAQLVALNKGEGHFVYINTCDNNYKARGVSLCQDREGVNRSQVHQRLISHVLQFISVDLPKF